MTGKLKLGDATVTRIDLGTKGLSSSLVPVRLKPG